MKYIYTLFIALGLTAATKLYANDNLVIMSEIIMQTRPRLQQTVCNR